MNDTSLHDTSGGAGSASTLRGRSGNAEGPSGSHYIIGPLQKASGPRKKKKTAMSHSWDTHHRHERVTLRKPYSIVRSHLCT